MRLDEETLAKLTTALSGDIELYNHIVNSFQEVDNEIQNLKDQLEETNRKLQESEARGQNYLNQISNLLSRIPIGETQTNVTLEQRIAEIANRAWTK